MTAPVVGSCGLPACTARVPKLCTGDGARGGVSMEPLMFEMEKGRIEKRRLKASDQRSSDEN